MTPRDYALALAAALPPISDETAEHAARILAATDEEMAA